MAQIKLNYIHIALKNYNFKKIKYLNKLIAN